MVSCQFSTCLFPCLFFIWGFFFIIIFILFCCCFFCCGWWACRFPLRSKTEVYLHHAFQISWKSQKRGTSPIPQPLMVTRAQTTCITRGGQLNYSWSLATRRAISGLCHNMRSVWEPILLSTEVKVVVLFRKLWMQQYTCFQYLQIAYMHVHECNLISQTDHEKKCIFSLFSHLFILHFWPI